MRVLIADPLDPGAVRILSDAGHEVIERKGLQGDALIEALEGCAALLVRSATKVTAEVIGRASALRVVVRAGTGLDNIDTKAANAAGIRVLNTPAANAISVAELVFAMLLAFERQVVPAALSTREGGWEKSRFAGREIAGRTLGLLGFGRIGREVALRARAFGMHVAAHDPLVSAWPPDFAWVRSLSLDELLAASDVLSLHVPLNDETRHRIGARELSRLKPGALLVHCARGGVVDEAALLQALRSGALRGACLDVFELEPPGQSPLLELANVLALPHLGASTREAQERAGSEAAELAVTALAEISAPR